MTTATATPTTSMNTTNLHTTTVSTTTVDTTPAAQAWPGVDPESPWLRAAHRVAMEVADDAAACDRSGAFVRDAINTMKQHQMLSMLVPAELGGGGATHAEACAALAAVARACPASALTLSMHTHLVALQVWRHKRAMPAPILSRVAAEDLMLVSTGASDWIDSQGTAVRVDGGFRVTGRKNPSSGCPAGDMLMSSACCDDGAQVIHFAVPFSAAGVSIDETWDTMGMRATGSHTVVLDDVFVAETAVSLTRPAGQWHPIFNAIVGVAMPLIMSVYVGVATEAVDRAIAVASRRRDIDVVVPVIGRMINRLVTAQDAAAASITMSDDLHFANTDDHAAAVLSRKTIAADACIDAVRLAMEVAGGAGYSTETGIERLYRDVHGSLYHPLPSAKQEMFSGRLALGLHPVVGRGAG